MSNGSPFLFDRALLLLSHHTLDHGFVVLDQLARQVDDELLDLAGESERGVVVSVAPRLSSITAARLRAAAVSTRGCGRR
jgi:hypothetical protein